MGCIVHLYWVPGYNNIAGNESADKAAKDSLKDLPMANTWISTRENNCVTRKWGQVQCLKVVWWSHGYVTNQTHDHLFIVVIALGCIQK